MKQHDYTKEEMSFFIDGLKEVLANPDVIKENFSVVECTLWCGNICGKTEYSACAKCMKFRLKVFLDIIKDVFVNNVPLIQATSQEPKEKKLHKYRLFSTYGETLDYREITDEQLRLLEYLQSNDLLGDEVDFEECEITNFKRI